MMDEPTPTGCGCKPKLIHSFAYDRSDVPRNSKWSYVSQGMGSSVIMVCMKPD